MNLINLIENNQYWYKYKIHFQHFRFEFLDKNLNNHLLFFIFFWFRTRV
jgi:hypothetical protein